MGCLPSSDLRFAIGHYMPGLFFLVMGIRWMNCIFYRYFLCHREQQTGKPNPRKFISTLSYPFRCAPTYHIECYIVYICCGFGATRELMLLRVLN